LHPDDVADYVAAAVAELERRAGETDLPSDERELVDRARINKISGRR
jgi:hypothetical protein